MSDKPEIKMMMFKRRGGFFLVACRGGQKGCNVNLKQRSKIGPCDFCVRARDDETIGQLYERLQKGDA